MSSVGWRQQPAGFRRAAAGRGDVDDDGYTWLDVSMVTFITLGIDAGA
jgi:hypothetical protein